MRLSHIFHLLLLETILFGRNLQAHSIQPKGGNMEYVHSSKTRRLPVAVWFLHPLFPWWKDSQVVGDFCQLDFKQTYPGFFHSFSLLLDSLQGEVLQTLPNHRRCVWSNLKDESVNSYWNQSWPQFYEHRIRNPKKSPHIFHELHTFWWQHLDGEGTHRSSGYCCCSGCDRLVILVPHIILVHEVISITIKEIKFRYSDSKCIYLFTTRSSRSS